MLARIMRTTMAVAGGILILPLVAAAMNKAEIEQEALSQVALKLGEYGYISTIKSMTPVAYNKDDASEVNCIFPQAWSGIGKLYFALIVKKEGAVLKNLPMAADIETRKTAVTATKNIEKGDIVEEESVTLSDVLLSKQTAKSYGSLEDVVGKKALVSILPGAPLTKDNLAKVLLIKSGQEVTTLYRAGGLTLTSRCIARMNGAKGDVIRVQNPSTNRLISATIWDAETVIVQ